MATQEPGFGFTGSLHNISACKRRDVDMIIIRSKGGPRMPRCMPAPQEALVPTSELSK